MKVLLLENPEHHNSSIANKLDLIVNPVGEVEPTASIDTVCFKLDNEKFDLVVIHHSNFKEVDSLKQKYPKMTFVGYAFEMLFINSTSGEKAKQTYLEHYDYLINKDLREILHFKKEQ